MLFSWPAIAIALFASLGRERGIIWSILVGYLFLPEARVHELPGLPDYDKFLAISCGSLLGLAFCHNRLSWPELPSNKTERNLALELQTIWAEALGLEIEDVPRDKGFRALGGASREAHMATRLMIKVGYSRRAAWGLQMGETINDLTRFEPTDGPAEVGSRSLTILVFFMLFAMSLSSYLTMLDNQAPLIDGDRFRSGLAFRDVINLISKPIIAVVPFYLAVQYLRTRRHFREVLVAAAILGSLYALLAALEVRLSPQLNNWIYGYFQHGWQQHLRAGGFRPLVFLDHGLSLGFFLLTAMLAALALFRTETGKYKYMYLGAAVWMLAVLLISKNLGAVMLAVIFVPLLILSPRVLQTKAIMVVSIVFLTYPMVRQAEIFPLERFVEFVTGISEERSASLVFRLNNETDLLARAAEKPLYGWGGWGRWRVIDEKGRDTTVSDGLWIIFLGERGWVGYICFFGTLTLPLFYLSALGRRRNAGPEVMAMGLIMAANLIYLVPNSTLTPVGWLLTGTIASFIRWNVTKVDEPVDEEEEVRTFSPYTRFTQNHVRPNLVPKG